MPYSYIIGERSEPPLSVELSEFSLYLYTVKGEIIAGLNNCVFADIWVFKH